MGFISGLLSAISVLKELLSIGRLLFTYLKKESDKKARAQMAKDLKTAIELTTTPDKKTGLRSTESLDKFFGVNNDK